MKKIIAALGIASLGFLSACGNSPEQDKVEQFVSTDEDKFLGTVAANMTPRLHEIPQASVVELGRTDCAALDEGVSIERLLIIAVQNDVHPTDAGLILGAAVRYFCPQHLDHVKSWLDQNNARSS